MATPIIRGEETTLRRRSCIASLALSVGLVAGGLIAPSPAYAASDNFSVWSDQQCGVFPDPAGVIRFVDYGEGDTDNPANNDDYIELVDNCRDYDGVKGYAWLNGTYLGERYNGNGSEGLDRTLIWDPFGNLPDGSRVGLKVCITNGPNGAPYGCSGLVSHTISEG